MFSHIMLGVFYYLLLLLVCISVLNVNEICLKLKSGIRIIHIFPTMR